MESVDVVGTAETVQTSSSGNFGNIVDQKAVTELPIVGVRGRNPLGLVNFQPGIVVGSNASASSVHAHGARDRAWNYTLDGADINETSAPGNKQALQGLDHSQARRDALFLLIGLFCGVR